ncbi:hypothetical protein ACFVHI_35470 [Kitasatospora sp. NPDC127121]|uniref:hypothetical protein n=1 Tax=Kitasatospora sp. NPDC127121 TaxID=3345371 RepID=UPI0036352017
MTYVSEESAKRIRDDQYTHTAGVRELAAAYLELMEEAGRVAALGEEWMGSPATEAYGRRLFDVINDEDDVIRTASDDVDDDQDVAGEDDGGQRPGLVLV